MEKHPDQGKYLEEVWAALKFSGLLAAWPALREDVIQDAIVIVASKYSHLDAESAGRLAFAIARNRMNSELRSRYGANRREQDKARIEPKVATPLEQVEAQDLSQRVTEIMVFALDEQERELVSRVFMQGQTLRTAAPALGMSLSTASRRLHRAMATLRAVLRDPP